MKTFKEMMEAVNPSEKESKAHVKKVHGSSAGFKPTFGGHLGGGSTSWEKTATDKSLDKYHELVQNAKKYGYELEKKNTPPMGWSEVYVHKATGNRMHVGQQTPPTGKSKLYITHSSR